MEKKILNIATRKLFILGSPDDEIEVVVGLPTLNKEADIFVSSFQIWFNSDLIGEKQIYGDDSVQALILNLNTIGAYLGFLNEHKFHGKLRQWPNDSEPDKYFGFFIPQIKTEDDYFSCWPDSIKQKPEMNQLLDEAFTLCKENYKSAVPLLKKAAKLNNKEALYALGTWHLLGRVLEKDYKKGVYFLQKAAHMNHPNAAHDLALCFELGVGVKQDYKKGLHWHKEALNLGCHSSALCIGRIYHYGSGIQKDYKKALQHYKIAAKYGSRDSCLFIVEMYSFGQGVKKSQRWMKYWKQRAKTLQKDTEKCE